MAVTRPFSVVTSEFSAARVVSVEAPDGSGRLAAETGSVEMTAPVES
jgi:hypothetical protein